MPSYHIAYLSISALVRVNYFTYPLKAQIKIGTVTEIFLLTSNNAKGETKHIQAPTAATLNDETLR